MRIIRAEQASVFVFTELLKRLLLFLSVIRPPGWENAAAAAHQHSRSVAVAAAGTGSGRQGQAARQTGRCQGPECCHSRHQTLSTLNGRPLGDSSSLPEYRNLYGAAHPPLIF